jgi:hypothetical protein
MPLKNSRSGKIQSLYTASFSATSTHFAEKLPAAATVSRFQPSTFLPKWVSAKIFLPPAR